MRKELEIPFSLRVLRRLPLPRKLGALERLFGATLARYGVRWVECANGVVWKLDLSDPCHRWIVFGKYEGGSGIDFALSVLKDGGAYVDSGANIGQWLLYLGHINDLYTLAFEPVKTERDWLKECIASQDGWHVDIIDQGLGSSSASLDIQVNGARSTLNMNWYKDKNYHRETVEIRRLDDVLTFRKVESVDFWKLDAEGAELQALIGAEEYLRDCKIKHIYFECHPSNYKEIMVYLASVNYQVFDLTESTLLRKTDDKIISTTDLVAMPLHNN